MKHTSHTTKRRMRAARWGWLAAFVLLCLVSAGGCGEPPKPIEAGASLAARTQARACPDALAKTAQSAFQGTPCDSDDATCQRGCVPSEVPTTPTQSPTDLFASCSQPDTLCVGPKQALKSIAEAAKKAQQDKAIKRIYIAPGVYKERVSFKGLKGPLLLEGQSNDPKGGVILEAPAMTKPSPEDAALTLDDTADITLRRLHIRGAGHGILARKVGRLSLEEVRVEENLRSGLTVKGCTDFSMTKSRVHKNGGQLQQQTLGALDYGITLIGCSKVLVKESEISRNGAGGLRSSVDEIAVSIDNNHRVIGHNEIAVSIDNNHRVTLEGNFIHHNGPVGFQGAGAGGACQPACGVDAFCEAGRCHPKLLRPADPAKPAGPVALVGAGVVIAGAGVLQASGNAFFGNDTAGMLLHSVASATLRENAISRNGVRPGASAITQRQFAFAALAVFGPKTKLEAQDNAFLDNLETGLSVVHKAFQGKAPGKLQITLQSNHWSGNGKAFAAANIPQGDGVRVVSEPQSLSLQMQVQENFFANNARAGAFVSGAVDATLANNLLQQHPFRALVLHDLGTSTSSVALEQNTIKGAHGYGIQLHGGQPKVSISGNRVQGIQALTGPQGAGRADAINLTNLSGQPAQISGNIIEQNKRAGLFLDKSKAAVQHNQFNQNQFAIVLQNGATVTGNTSTPTHKPTTALPNAKN